MTGLQSKIASPEQKEIDAEQNRGRNKANSQEAHGVSPFFLSQRMEHARETELEPQEAHQSAEFEQVIGLSGTQVHKRYAQAYHQPH